MEDWINPTEQFSINKDIIIISSSSKCKRKVCFLPYAKTLSAGPVSAKCLGRENS